MATYMTAWQQVAGTMLVFMHAMVCFPEVQARMRDEIHKVVGTDRLPSFDDRKRLPYINAAIKEVYRWNPNTPMGAPRKLQDVDVYRGISNRESDIEYFLNMLSRVLHTERHHHYDQCLVSRTNASMGCTYPAVQATKSGPGQRHRSRSVCSRALS